MLAQLQAIAARGCEAVMPCPMAEPWLIKQVLDNGAQTLFYPDGRNGRTGSRSRQRHALPAASIRGVGAVLARSNFDRIGVELHRTVTRGTRTFKCLIRLLFRDPQSHLLLTSAQTTLSTSDTSVDNLIPLELAWGHCSAQFDIEDTERLSVSMPSNVIAESIMLVLPTSRTAILAPSICLSSTVSDQTILVSFGAQEWQAMAHHFGLILRDRPPD